MGFSKAIWGGGWMSGLDFATWLYSTTDPMGPDCEVPNDRSPYSWRHTHTPTSWLHYHYVSLLALVLRKIFKKNCRHEIFLFFRDKKKKKLLSKRNTLKIILWKSGAKAANLTYISKYFCYHIISSKMVGAYFCWWVTANQNVQLFL